MIKFNSPVIPENTWELYLKTTQEITDLYNEDKGVEDKKEKVPSVIDLTSATIYIDKDLEDNDLLKAIIKKLVNLYLWETGQQDHLFTEEEFCDLTSTSAPIILKTAEELILKIKKEKEEM